MLLAAVLNGREPLARAAARVRSSVRLIEAFKNATSDDLVLLNRAVGGRAWLLWSPSCSTGSKRHSTSKLRNENNTEDANAHS